FRQQVVQPPDVVAPAQVGDVGVHQALERRHDGQFEQLRLGPEGTEQQRLRDTSRLGDLPGAAVGVTPGGEHPPGGSEEEVAYLLRGSSPPGVTISVLHNSSEGWRSMASIVPKFAILTGSRLAA